MNNGEIIEKNENNPNSENNQNGENKKKEGITFGKALAAPFAFIINKGKKMSLARLIITCIILLVAPYAYVWLCGVVDLLLFTYFTLNLIMLYFVTMVMFFVIDVIAVILLITGYALKGKRGKR